MDAVIQESSNKSGFFKSFFSLTKDEKSESLNFLQYTILAIVPLVILARVNQLIWPVADEKKGSIEILAEVLGEVLFTGIIVFIVYRIIDFIPTYSGVPLKGINMLSIVTVFMLTLPWYDSTSNLGTKVKNLHSRIDERLPSFFGIEENKTKKSNTSNGNGNGNNGVIQMAQPTHESSRADYLGAHDRLASGGGGGGGGGGASQLQKPNYPTFDNMYQQNPPQVQNSAPQEAMQHSMEPSAANEALGGSFGSAF